MLGGLGRLAGHRCRAGVSRHWRRSIPAARPGGWGTPPFLPGGAGGRHEPAAGGADRFWAAAGMVLAAAV